jgi:hypothetical protein
MKTQRHTHPNFFRFLLRAFQILRRYGLSSKKMEAKLDQYVNILREHNIRPTFPITAEVLKRHSRVIEKYLNDGVEFAIHGFQHIDYSKLSEEEIFQHLGKSIDLFRQNNILFSGFRFPYLKFDKKCMDALSRFPIKWDSSHSVYWDVRGDLKAKNVKWQNYESMLNQYDYKNSSSHVSLPRIHGSLLEIPVSLPDDDLLERLGVKGNGLAKEIWGEILAQTYLRGELFALQLHPERIFLFGEALVSLIESSRQFSPRVWIARMSDIFKWWAEKKTFSVNLDEKGNGIYEVDAECSTQATILVKSNGFENGKFYNGFDIVKERRFSIKSKTRPIIGIPENSPSELREFLKNEGFIYEINENKGQYSVYLNNFRDFSEKDELKALEIINRGESPLIRFWRWPFGYKSAVTITGDIDALTSADFLLSFSG